MLAVHVCVCVCVCEGECVLLIMNIHDTHHQSHDTHMTHTTNHMTLTDNEVALAEIIWTDTGASPWKSMTEKTREERYLQL